MRIVKTLNVTEMNELIDFNVPAISPEGDFIHGKVEFSGDEIGELCYSEPDEYEDNENYNGYFIQCEGYRFNTKAKK